MTDQPRNAVLRFVDDDAAYLRWIAENSGGFVINCASKPRADYLVLHRATCATISTDKRTNWTTGDFIKVCSLDLAALGRWAADEPGGDVSPCELCKPGIPSSDAASAGSSRSVPQRIDCGCEALDRAWQRYATSILERPGVLIPDTEDALNWHSFLGHGLDMQGFRAAEFVGVDPLSREAPGFVPLQDRGIGIQELARLWHDTTIRDRLLGNLKDVPVAKSLELIAAQGGEIGRGLADSLAAFPFRKTHKTVRAMLQNCATLQDDQFSFRNWLQRTCRQMGVREFPPRDFRAMPRNAERTIEMEIRHELQEAFYLVGPALAPYMVCDWQLWLWSRGRTEVFSNFKLDSFHEAFVAASGGGVLPAGEHDFAEWWLARYPGLPPRLANECIWLAMEHGEDVP